MIQTFPNVVWSFANHVTSGIHTKLTKIQTDWFKYKFHIEILLDQKRRFKKKRKVQNNILIYFYLKYGIYPIEIHYHTIENKLHSLE